VFGLFVSVCLIYFVLNCLPGLLLLVFRNSVDLVRYVLRLIVCCSSVCCLFDLVLFGLCLRFGLFGVLR